MYVCYTVEFKDKAKNFEQESINLEFYKIFINKCYFKHSIWTIFFCRIYLFLKD